MRRIGAVVVVLSLAAVACNGSQPEALPGSTTTTVLPDAPVAAFQAARALWEGAAPADYTVAFAAPGEEGQLLAVHEGEVVSLATTDPTTVEEVFAAIEDSIAQGAEVDVDYDDAMGYPTHVVIDRDRDGVTDFQLSFAELTAMPIVQSLDELLAARAKWEASRPDAYRYIMRAECTCEDGGTFSVDVRNGTIAQWMPLDAAAERSDLTPTTLDVAFDDLEDWFTDNRDLVADGLLAVDVRMDPKLGYPRWFKVIGEGIGDGEFAPRFQLVVTIDLIQPLDPIEPPGTPVVAADRAELDAAMARWDRADLDGFRYQLQLICECPLSVSGPFEVTVTDGAVASVVPLGDPAGSRPDVVFIEELFETIAVIVDSPVDIEIDVTYHPVFGYPELAILDVPAVAVDGGQAFRVGELSLLGDEGMIAGQALSGPQCPVMQDPPLPECLDQPVPEATLVLGHETWREPLEVDIAADGTFVVADLPPGTYALTPQPLPGFLGNPGPIEVTVAAGTIHQVEILYDTGIR